MFPQFVCIGFQKCGTTTLADILKQHHGLLLTRDVKEPMFYRVLGFRSILGKKFYEKRYFGHAAKAETHMSGEINAGLSFTGCAKKIAQDYPKDTKLIFMMRNPVDRCYSAYKYFMALGFLPLKVMKDDAGNGHQTAFANYTKKSLSSPDCKKRFLKKRLKYLCFSQSCYTACINEYLRYFPKENMKFIIFEEFIKNQEENCKDIYNFLGITDDITIDYKILSNEGVIRAASPIKSKIGIIFMGLYYLFFEFMDLSRKAPRFYKHFENQNRRIQNRCVVRDTDNTKMNAETRTRLENFYRAEKSGIEALIGRDLSPIWYQ